MRFLSRLPFRVHGRPDWPLVILYLLVNGLVAVNAALHNPLVGYDMDNHFEYVLALSEGRFPTPGESDEFFSPPLPYTLPALLVSAARVSPWRAAKYAQWLNVLLSLGLTFTLLKLCDYIQPGRRGIKLAALALLGMLPVYYKSFAQLRGEPFVAFLAVLAAAQTMSIFVSPPLFGWRLWLRAAGLGVTLGLIVLSRQWGFFLFPALALFVGGLALKRKSLAQLWRLLASFGVAFGVGGWFYLVLFSAYGSFTAFNRQPEPFAFNNQPPSFYFDLGLGQLFRDPVRPSFPNRLWPILYADTWGDYWGYFLIASKDLRSEWRGDGVLYLTGKPLEEAFAQNPPPEWLATNRFQISGYLGRVNLVSLLPSGLLLAGALLGVRHGVRFFYQKNPVPATSALALVSLLVLLSFAGFVWFLVRYPSLETGGNNIKATYLLHIYPFLALLAGHAVQSLVDRWRPAAWGLGAALALVFCHNLPAMVTRYPMWSTHLLNLFSPR